jgi:hypothetical protein
MAPRKGNTLGSIVASNGVHNRIYSTNKVICNQLEHRWMAFDGVPPESQLVFETDARIVRNAY